MNSSYTVLFKNNDKKKSVQYTKTIKGLTTRGTRKSCEVNNAQKRDGENVDV